MWKKHDKILLLAKTKLSIIEVLISRDLIDSWWICFSEQCVKRILWYVRRNWKYNNFKSSSKVLINFLKKCYSIAWGIDETESKNFRVKKSNKGKLVLLSKCAVSHNKKSRFSIEQEASVLFSSLELKTPLSKIPVPGDVLF